MLGVKCTALLNWSQEGVRTLASACALRLTTNYSCPSILGAFRFRVVPDGLEEIWEFGSYPELIVVQRGERRGQE